MIRLSVVRGVDAGTVRLFEADLVRIGRDESSELCLRAPHVSADHASIAFTGEAYVLRDHHSTNGTRVLRGALVRDLADEPGRELTLELGDRIELGEPSTGELIEVFFDEAEPEGIVSMVRVEEVAALVDRSSVDHAALRSLYEAQRTISAATELDEIIDAASAAIFSLLERATHVTVALRAEDELERGRKSAPYVPVGTRVRGGTRAEVVPITRSVFRKVVQERAAVLAADARRDVGESASMLAAEIVSTIGLPLWQGEVILGVLQVDNRERPAMFREQDLDRVALLGQSISQSIANARLVARLRVAEERQRSENDFLKQREEHRRGATFIGESAAMRQVFDQLAKVADTRVTVLIEGETGTGKEVAASAVHYGSRRRAHLFVAQNCAALPENLLESELFGHRKGAFTGATEDKKGLFELADGGTLFLDEVGEMPLALQAKLLRALQEGEIRPVGASRTKRVDVRIVAATNRDLVAEMSAGRFREDLYYRLSVFPVRIPPLRERREDVPLLVQHFLRHYAGQLGRTTAVVSQEAMEALTAYDWPGNVRELQNEVQRLIIQLDEGKLIEPAHLSERLRRAENVVVRVRPTKGTLREMMDEVERWILKEALREHDNNKSATAKSLGITREGLHKKLKGLGMA